MSTCLDTILRDGERGLSLSLGASGTSFGTKWDGIGPSSSINDNADGLVFSAATSPSGDDLSNWSVDSGDRAVHSMTNSLLRTIRIDNKKLGTLDQWAKTGISAPSSRHGGVILRMSDSATDKVSGYRLVWDRIDGSNSQLWLERIARGTDTRSAKLWEETPVSNITSNIALHAVNDGSDVILTMYREGVEVGSYTDTGPDVIQDGYNAGALLQNNSSGYGIRHLFAWDNGQEEPPHTS